MLCYFLIHAMSLIFLIFFLPSTASENGVSVGCTDPEIAYGRRSILTYICPSKSPPSTINNYCMRDDIAATKSNSHLYVKSGGCPDHEYFGNFSSSSSNNNEQLTPRFHEYIFELPVRPIVSYGSSGVTFLATDEDGAIGPVGIAVNGVLLFHEHTEHENIAYYFDSCLGHSDSSARYHYRLPPLCLLKQLRETLPAGGDSFVSANSSEDQLSYWSKKGKASAVLGYILDGFPIYGAYNSSGDLQYPSSLAGGTLDECNFNRETQRYHLSPISPYMPPCWVGEKVGTFSDRVMSLGVCPNNGYDSFYCQGRSCVPNNQECKVKPLLLSKSLIWWINFSLFMTFLFVYFVYTVVDFIHPYPFRYPLDKALLSIFPSFIILLMAADIYKFFYGVSDNAKDYTLDEENIDIHLNSGISAFLTVTGVLYSLQTAHLFTLTNEKYNSVRDTIGAELAACKQVSLCIKALVLDSNDPASVSVKKKALKVVSWYVQSMAKSWTTPRTSADTSLDVLYGVLPVVARLCSASHDPFNIAVAERIVDSLNELTTAKYQRYALDDQRLPNTLWALQYLLSTSMFAGVIMIYSGSMELNLSMCYIATTLIGFIALVIADMDVPYVGLVALSHDPVYELLNYLVESQDDHELHTNLDKRNSVFMKSPLGKLSSQTLSTAQNVSSKRDKKRISFLNRIVLLGSKTSSSVLDEFSSKQVGNSPSVRRQVAPVVSFDEREQQQQLGSENGIGKDDDSGGENLKTEE